MSLLPTPFEDFVPKMLRQILDESQDGQALVDKMNEYIDNWSKDILEMQFLKMSERCPSDFLDVLGNYINAGIKEFDSETIKRIKIATAVQGHKKRGTWNSDAKIKIDVIAGGDSQIIRAIDSADWILLAGESDDPDNYWATLGVDGIDDNLGIDLSGDFTEITEAGNIYIDTDNDSLTSDQIDQIVIELQDDIVPAYMRIYLGYVDGTGSFVLYTTIG